MGSIETENRVIGAIENKTMKHKRRSIYTACEDMDFVWCEDEVKLFDQMWLSGFHIIDIAQALNRDTDEVGILAIDRANKGHITNRKGGLYGRRIT